jgi:hypothetical protein
MKLKLGKGDKAATEKAAAADEKPVKERPNGKKSEPDQDLHQSMWRGALGAMIRNNLLVAAVVMGGGALLLQFLYGTQVTLASGERARLAAEALAGRITDRVADYRQTLERLAAQPGLPDLIDRPEAAALARQESALRELAPNATYVRVLPRDWELNDETFGKGLSFAALDLVRKVEKGGRAAAPSCTSPRRASVPL